MPEITDRGNNREDIQKRGFSLPTTSSKPPMPPVKPPKKEEEKK